MRTFLKSLLTVVLLATTSLAQTWRMPARQVSVETNNLQAVPIAKTNAQLVIDWLDDVLPTGLSDTNQLITAGDVFTGYLLKGTPDVHSTNIIDGTVSNVDLAASSVGTSNIVDGTVAAVDLATNAVTTEKILDGTILAVDLSTNSVTTEKITDGTIRAEDLSLTLQSNLTQMASVAILASASSNLPTTATAARLYYDPATNRPSYYSFGGVIAATWTNNNIVATCHFLAYSVDSGGTSTFLTRTQSTFNGGLGSGRDQQVYGNMSFPVPAGSALSIEYLGYTYNANDDGPNTVDWTLTRTR